MTKITEYFYIFSKLTTSLVLFLIIIVMGYAFFKSYQGIDDNNVNLENKISSLSSDVMLNYNNFEKIVKKINDTDKSIDEIKKILLQKDTDTKNANYKEDIENLIKLNEELQKQVDKLTLNLKNIDNEVNTDSRSIESRQIPTLIKLIFIKYENGESVRNEILLLEDLLQPNKEEIFEKVSEKFIDNFILKVLVPDYNTMKERELEICLLHRKIRRLEICYLQMDLKNRM